MIDARDVAWRAVDAKLTEGTQKHDRDAWRGQPASMHIQKGARHSMTAMLLLEHPDHCTDPETTVQHLEQALARFTMALTQLLEKENHKGLRQFYAPGQ